jgi:hypothetical protein
MVQAGLLLMAVPAVAQVQFGEASTNLNGTISSGYSATYGNLTPSTHSWTIGGDATFSGYYHSPNFLSFTVSPYLNQSSANSDFQSISDASGVNATVNIFNGSKFPGAVTYSKAYNSEGNYAVPGLADYVTHGNSDSFGINWSENLPNAPSFSAGFQMGNSSYSVYGISDQGTNAFHSTNLHSAYTWEGFNMGAYYVNGGGHSDVPALAAGAPSTEIRTGNSGEGFNVNHLLPWSGSVSGSYNRSTWDSDYLGFTTSGTINLLNTVATVRPRNNLSVSGSANYSDNLAGQLAESVVGVGGIVPAFNTNQSSDSLDLLGTVTYTPMPNLQTDGFVERRTQSFLGQDYGVTSYGGGGTYAHALAGGTLNGSVNVSANAADNTGRDTLGFSATGNYSNIVRGWHLNGSFGYAQNVQTLIITYMNSFYNYSVSARRRWGQFNLGVGAGGSNTALTDQPGTANNSQSYNASVAYGTLLTATGTYARSSGQALLTGTGLVPVPIPSPILPSSLVSLYGGDSYAFSLSAIPTKRLVIAATFGKAITSTTNNSILSSNETNQLNSIVQYRVRKLNFVSGYARLEQGFSGSGRPTEIISSYYMGVSRWFNFF